jgi:uncharacterized membrane protein YsdA (DUF1294 family)
MSEFYDGLLKAVLVYYLAAAALTAAVYGIDKFAAVRGWWRVRERSLHMLALLGGWPGAYLGQRLFRHKTRKQPFRTVFWVTAGFNLAFLVWLLSPFGAGWAYEQAAILGWALDCTVAQVVGDR